MVVLKFNQDLYIGAWLIGVIVSTILFGILTIQCMFYLNRFKRDRWFFKALVLIVWSLDLIIISLGALWTYLAILRNFGDDSGVFRSAQWTIAPACVDISLNGFLVQLFFARRGYLLNRSLWMISLSAVILATLSFVSGITFTVIMRIVVQDHGSAVYAWLNYLWFTSAAATDLLVALIVVFSLGANSHSYSFHAKRGLRKLMIYTISNGILTSVVAVAGVVLAFVVPPSWIQPALSFVLARLYSNSLLASLNLRGRWISGQRPTDSSNELSIVRHAGTITGHTGNETPIKPLFSAITLADPDGFHPSTTADKRPAQRLASRTRTAGPLSKHPINDVVRSPSPELID